MYSISIKELLKIINKVTIIDIRSVEKYNDNHMPSAINIPYSNLISTPDKYLNFKTIYYIYCKEGVQSTKVCNYLRKRGYKTVNIIGGYESWLLEK